MARSTSRCSRCGASMRSISGRAAASRRTFARVRSTSRARWSISAAYRPERNASTSPPGMAITLNGIAQGYITDRVADLLRNEGFDQAMVDLGEWRALGSHPDGRPWRAATRERRHRFRRQRARGLVRRRHAVRAERTIPPHLRSGDAARAPMHARRSRGHRAARDDRRCAGDGDLRGRGGEGGGIARRVSGNAGDRHAPDGRAIPASLAVMPSISR